MRPVKSVSNSFSPLRYPGGKGRLAAYVKEILRANKLYDGEYVEPYAGGAAIALELLIQDYVSIVRINDISRPVHAFWKAVLNQTDELAKLVETASLTVEEWDRQKAIFINPKSAGLTLGFAFFYLNRTNRSGILNAGIIGGRAQAGEWKIDARYNAEELVERIRTVAKFRDRIFLTNQDALTFLAKGSESWPDKTLIYCDPPYYVKGRDLYYNYYGHADHVAVASRMLATTRQRWIVSYDNVEAIRTMYGDSNLITYDIGYSARSARAGSEVMFFDPKLRVPTLVGAVVETERRLAAA
jgi:DNA adenine methylase